MEKIQSPFGHLTQNKSLGDRFIGLWRKQLIQLSIVGASLKLRNGSFFFRDFLECIVDHFLISLMNRPIEISDRPLKTKNLETLFNIKKSSRKVEMIKSFRRRVGIVQPSCEDDQCTDADICPHCGSHLVVIQR
jgi:hypothetical protein